MTKGMKRGTDTGSGMDHRVWWTGLGDKANAGNKAKEKDSQFSDLSNGTIF